MGFKRSLEKQCPKYIYIISQVLPHSLYSIHLVFLQHFTTTCANELLQIHHLSENVTGTRLDG